MAQKSVDAKTGKPLESLLGMARVELPQAPLGGDSPVFWGLYCLAPEQTTSRAAIYLRSQARLQQHLTTLLQSAWPCNACGRPCTAHLIIEASSGMTLDEAFRAHRAMRLNQEAQQPSPPPTVSPEDLKSRGTVQDTREAATSASDETIVAPPEASAGPHTPKPPGARRGPHADRLDKARAAQPAATQPKPAKRPARPKDPFDEEDTPS